MDRRRPGGPFPRGRFFRPGGQDLSLDGRRDDRLGVRPRRGARRLVGGAPRRAGERDAGLAPSDLPAARDREPGHRPRPDRPEQHPPLREAARPVALEVERVSSHARGVSPGRRAPHRFRHSLQREERGRGGQSLRRGAGGAARRCARLPGGPSRR